jgi:Ca-activated chloride channel family protein
MTFRWPWLLAVLLIVPIAIAVYVWLERRKRKYAVRFASLSLIRDAVPRHSRWRRHLPFALLLVAVASLVFAMARPATSVPVPKSKTSIMLTLDVSRSMCSTDVTPNRLAAAQSAAKALIEKDQGVRFGIVEFSSEPQLIVAPTTDTHRLDDAIDSLQVGGGTAIGSGILESIDALSKVNPEIAPSTVNVGKSSSGTNGSKGYQPDIVVLLTDGANNRGVDPSVAAAQAADRRVRVYTVGFGTDNPGELVCTRNQLGSDPFGGGFGGGGFGGGGFAGGGFGGNGSSRFVDADQQALQDIAHTTGGLAFRAASADQLLKVFRQLPARVHIQTERHEISVLFVGVGALLAILALGLSLRWNRYA